MLPCADDVDLALSEDLGQPTNDKSQWAEAAGRRPILVWIPQRNYHTFF